jgi:hypothetical protein
MIVAPGSTTSFTGQRGATVIGHELDPQPDRPAAAALDGEYRQRRVALDPRGPPGRPFCSPPIQASSTMAAGVLSRASCP